jgi:hypothetical protein
MSKKRKKKKNKALATRHYHYYDYYFYSLFVPFSSLSPMTFATSLCHSHPVFLKTMMKKRAQREGGRLS